MLLDDDLVENTILYVRTSGQNRGRNCNDNVSGGAARRGEPRAIRPPSSLKGASLI